MDKDEFLRIVTEYVESQYNDLGDTDYDGENFICLSSGPEEKAPPVELGILDLTLTKSYQISDKLKNFNNIRVGKFLIKIISRRSNEVDVIVYETKNNNKLIVKVDISKDTRFSGKDWSPYFNTFKFGHKIPTVKLIEIIRWTQAIQKISAFS